MSSSSRASSSTGSYHSSSSSNGKDSAVSRSMQRLSTVQAQGHGRYHPAAAAAVPQPWTAQNAAALATRNHANAYANHPSAYPQRIPQAAAYQQVNLQAALYQLADIQAWARQQLYLQEAARQQANPQAGAFQQGIPQGATYQQGTPQAGAYQQGTPQAGGYAYPMAHDNNAYQMHATPEHNPDIQLAMGYPVVYAGYPVAGYAQPIYPDTYAAPEHPTTRTDGTYTYSAAASTGYPYPAALVEANGGAANTGQAPPAPYPATYDPTGGPHM